MNSKMLNLIPSLRKQITSKDSRFHQVLLNVIEELGAWLLTAGFFLGIFWVVQIAF
jgi:hypothetical protein